MRRALDEIRTWLSDGQNIVLVDLAFKLFRSCGDHVLDRLDIVSLVDWNEGNRVTGIGFDVGRLKNHCTFSTLIEHVNLNILGQSGSSHRKAKSECCERDSKLTHLISSP
ncbi:hypothetical protein D3C80_445450 [compost metagenome]